MKKTRQAKKKRRSLREAAQLLVDTINSTGGLVRDPRDGLVPAGAPEWLDLSDAHIAACEALGVEVKVNGIVNQFGEVVFTDDKDEEDISR